MNTLTHRFPAHGRLGLVLLLVMETAVFCGQSDALAAFPWWKITAWTTPSCWWGYIFVVDAWIYRCRGESLLMNRRDTFWAQCLLSIAFWCVFEAYNLVMPGWQYINLPADRVQELLGYPIAFATIMPGLFLTAELLEVYRVFGRARIPRVRWSPAALNLSILVGAAFCLVPPLMPADVRGYLWAFVWTGWFFLLEPLNYRRGMPSIYRDWEQGDLSRTAQLFAAGGLCGLLWEFWNMWAYTKWVYTFPLGQSLRYFEMPLVGFLGFLPFALEFFVLFHCAASLFTRQDRLHI
jgi:hypothetical protein